MTLVKAAQEIKMEVKIGDYTFENDIDVKCIPDGWEIFTATVDKFNLSLEDFGDRAKYGMYGSIIIAA